MATGRPLADKGPGDIQFRHLQPRDLPIQDLLHLFTRRSWPRGNRQIHSLKDLRRSIPGRKIDGRVRPQDQRDLDVIAECLQGIGGESPPVPVHLSVISLEVVDTGHRQSGHFPAMLGRRKPPTRFLPGSSGRDEEHPRQPQLTVGHLSRMEVGEMRRVEGSTEKSYMHRSQDREPNGGPDLSARNDTTGKAPDSHTHPGLVPTGERPPCRGPSRTGRPPRRLQQLDPQPRGPLTGTKQKP